MRSNIHLRGLGFLASALMAFASQAQSFPSDSNWVPLRCASEVMTDPYRDESRALAERDLVGDGAAAAGFRSSDSQYLYLRLRLDQDPIPEGNARQFAWGVLLDLNRDLANYEVLLLVNGVDGTAAIYKNTVTTLRNDPTDPPDSPAVKTYSLSTNARTVVAVGSSFGGNPDYFLDVAIPWVDLEAVGLTPSTPVTAWAATSATSTSLNGDFACFNDASGNPTLSGTASVITVLDPGVDTDGDGYSDATELAAGTDPRNAADHPSGAPDGRQIAGGGGCATAGGECALGLLLVVAFILVHRRTGAVPGPVQRMSSM